MKSNGQLQEQPDYPPPAYSPPGREAPLQMQSKDNFKRPTAPPPPPGLHATAPDSPDGQQQPIIIYNTTTHQSVQFGPYPMRLTCPHCNAHVMTETHSTPGLLTYILSGALCVIAPCILCCLIPCCVRECKDIEHRCPNCQHKLGLFKRI